MRQFFQDVLVQLRGIWGRLEGPQRLVVGTVLFATLVGLGAVVWFASKPSYEKVFQATSSEDLTRAEQAITQGGVSTVAGPDGRSLMVERSDVQQALLALGKEGLNTDSVPGLDIGGSLIEDAATKQWRLDSVARQQVQAAIKKLEGVMDVTVTSSRPRRRLAFRSRQSKERASATVLLRLRPGVAFDERARAAASIAASQLMVPMENIDIVSATGGNRWSYDPDRDAGGGSSEFRKMERAISSERTMQAQAALDRMWPGKTEVRVTIELDPSWEVRSEKVLPEGALLRSEDVTKDSSDVPAVAADASAGKSKNEKRKREYVTEIGERRVGKMAPEVRRMSVALLYDSELENQEGFVQNNLVDTVKAIAGWNDERDTQFSTLSGPFEPPPEFVPMEEGPGLAAMARQWGPMIGQMVGVIVVVLFLRGLFKKSSPSAKGAGASEEAPKELAEEDLTPEEQQKRMRREIERSIAGDPAALAKMLEAWLLEQKA
ncbi:MAG: hypothetical protein AB8H80_02125 [Planctomycetota bacterium]